MGRRNSDILLCERSEIRKRRSRSTGETKLQHACCVACLLASALEVALVCIDAPLHDGLGAYASMHTPMKHMPAKTAPPIQVRTPTPSGMPRAQVCGQQI